MDRPLPHDDDEQLTPGTPPPESGADAVAADAVNAAGAANASVPAADAAPAHAASAASAARTSPTPPRAARTAPTSPPPVRFTCTTCGYDITEATVDGTCSECGTPVLATLRQLRTTRTHPTESRATVALICGVVGLFTGCLPVGVVGLILGWRVLASTEPQPTDRARLYARIAVFSGALGTAILLVILVWYGFGF